MTDPSTDAVTDAATDAAPGWDAIDSALARVYPGVEPYHLATIIKHRIGGPDPLDGVSVYPADGHWHLVSYGMSELYEKESQDADESGWGFEFTFRVKRYDSEATPPHWAANFLQGLARYVFSTGNVFGPGHYMDLNGSICQEREDSAIRYVAFTVDPELGEIATPHGRLRFLQAVGLTAAEYDAAQAWSGTSLLSVLAAELPYLVTDLDRGCMLDRPHVAQAVAEGVARDGSSSSASFVTQLDWSGDRVVVGAHAAPRLATSLHGRLPFGRDFTVFSQARQLTFVPGERLEIVDESAQQRRISVPPELVAPLAAGLTPTAGRSTVGGLTLEVVPTEIKDQDGNVLYVIGAPAGG